MWSDAQKYVQECQTCQTTNDAKFQNLAAPLHPPSQVKSVESGILSGVCICMYCALLNSVHHHY